VQYDHIETSTAMLHFYNIARKVNQSSCANRIRIMLLTVGKWHWRRLLQVRPHTAQTPQTKCSHRRDRERSSGTRTTCPECQGSPHNYSSIYNRAQTLQSSFQAVRIYMAHDLSATDAANVRLLTNSTKSIRYLQKKFHYLVATNCIMRFQQIVTN